MPVGENNEPFFVCRALEQIGIRLFDRAEGGLQGRRKHIVNKTDIRLRTGTAFQAEVGIRAVVFREVAHAIYVQNITLAEHRSKHFHCVLCLAPAVDLFVTVVIDYHRARIVIYNVYQPARLSCIGEYGDIDDRDKNQYRKKDNRYSSYSFASFHSFVPHTNIW